MSNDLKPGPAVLGRPTLKQRTRQEHDAIVALMNEKKLTWEEACAQYEAAQNQ